MAKGGSGLLLEVPGWRVENDGTELSTEDSVQPASEDVEYFKKTFVGKDHRTFAGYDPTLGAVVVSVLRDGLNGYVGYLRSEQGYQRLSVSREDVQSSCLRRMLWFPPSDYEINTALCPELASAQLTLCQKVDLAQTLYDMDSRQVVKNFKFGVLYRAPGQQTEEQIYNNKDGSAPFETFLGLIGTRCKLSGFEGFKGGLDVKGDTTGNESVYTRYKNAEVMFHVSTMLPFNPADSQQVERKRHIGNDLVSIVFQDTPDPLPCNVFVSKQTHVVVLVCPAGNTAYMVDVACKDNVPPFGPPTPSVVTGDELGSFLVRKLINAELSCYNAPNFKTLAERTRKAMVQEMVKTALPGQ